MSDTFNNETSDSLASTCAYAKSISKTDMAGTVILEAHRGPP